MIASKKAIMRRLTDIVKKGLPWTPDPYVDMQQVKPLTVALLLNAERNHCPEDRLDMLRELLEIVVEGEQAMQPPPPDPSMMMGPDGQPLPPEMQPGAAPEMAPPGVPPPGMPPTPPVG
jgi:hypothetical protein